MTNAEKIETVKVLIKKHPGSVTGNDGFNDIGDNARQGDGGEQEKRAVGATLSTLIKFKKEEEHKKAKQISRRYSKHRNPLKNIDDGLIHIPAKKGDGLVDE
jgi:hypothetical protein